MLNKLIMGLKIKNLVFKYNMLGHFPRYLVAALYPLLIRYFYYWPSEPGDQALAKCCTSAMLWAALAFKTRFRKSFFAATSNRQSNEIQSIRAPLPGQFGNNWADLIYFS